jgi:hypothetical protein
MFNLAKNMMTGKAAQMYVNKLIARYGEVRDLRIDPDRKTIDLVCHLLGEGEPLKVRVDKYAVQQKGDRHFVQLVQCTCSRQWVQNLIEDYAKGRPVEIPSWAASAL